MTIHTFNSREFILWEFLRDYYKQSSEEIYKEIKSLYAETVFNLSSIGIDYKGLKNTLTPQKNGRRLLSFLTLKELKAVLMGQLY